MSDRPEGESQTDPRRGHRPRVRRWNRCSRRTRDADADAGLGRYHRSHLVDRRVREFYSPARRSSVPVDAGPRTANPASIPGGRLTDAIAQFNSREVGRSYVTRRSVNGLRSAVTAVLTRFQGRSEASAAIDDGSWTEDPIASAFLSEDIDSPPQSVRDRITDRIGRDDPYRRGIRRTAVEIAESATANWADDRPRERSDRKPGRDGKPRRRTNHGSTPRGRKRTRASMRPTGHWTGVGVVALVAIGIGTFAELSALVLAGVVGIGYAGFAYLSSPPSPTLEIERTLSDDDPEPGDEIDVVVSVRNVGSGPILDLRYVDGVPADLRVIEGTARIGTALRPGETATLEYGLTVTTGTHEFDPALVVTRDLSRSAERAHYVGAPTTIVCEPVFRPIDAPSRYRQRRPGSPADSRPPPAAPAPSSTPFGSTGETTRSTESTGIDTPGRENSRPSSSTRSVPPACSSSSTRGKPPTSHRLPALSTRSNARPTRRRGSRRRCSSPGYGRPRAIGPTSRAERGGRHLLAPARVRESPPDTASRDACNSSAVFASRSVAGWPVGEPASNPSATTVGRNADRPVDSAADRASLVIARRLASHGHAVTVVSPDPTAEETTGQQLARVARRVRRFDLQRSGIPVVDWGRTDSIDELFARYEATIAGGRR